MASILNWEDHDRLVLFTRNTQTQVLHHALKSSRGLCLHVSYVLDGAIISLFGAKAGGKIAKLRVEKWPHRGRRARWQEKPERSEIQNSENTVLSTVE